MSTVERDTWAWVMALLGIFAAFCFGGLVGSGGDVRFLYLALMFGVAFGTAAIIWLFRVTFLAGRRYG